MMNSIYFIFLVSTSAFWSVSQCQEAPLLVWTSEDLPHCSPDIELRPELSLPSVFTRQYLNCVEEDPPKNVVVFILEAFSSKPFIQRVYQSLHSIHTLIKRSGFSIPSIRSSGVLEDLELIADTEFSDSNLITEYIEVSADYNNVEGYVMDVLDKMDGSYLAVMYSSLTRQPFSDGYQMNMGRHLLEAADAPVAASSDVANYCIIGSCVQLCFSSLSYGNNKDELSPIVPINSTAINSTLRSDFDIEEGKCDTNNTSKTPKFVSVVKTFSSNDTQLKINMTFEQKMWDMAQVFWALYAIDVNGNKLSSRTFYPDVSAPSGWSYGCASPESYTDAKLNDFLQFKNLTVQAFIKDSTKFGRMFDCSGWFTGPIWVGLLVSLLLITMLSYAYGMISSITTMDKFDNPKGKTISVPQDS